MNLIQLHNNLSVTVVTCYINVLLKKSSVSVALKYLKSVILLVLNTIIRKLSILI